MAAWAVALGLPARSARGDEAPPPYQLGVAAGLRFFSGATGLGRYADDSADNAPLLASPLAAARLARSLTDRWALEVEAGLIPTRTRDGDASFWIATGALRGIFRLAPRMGLLPFVAGGFGLAAARSSDTVVVENDVDGSIHAGVGVWKPLGSAVLLRIEARIHWSPAFGVVRNPAREDVAVPPEPELLVGVSFPFGARASGHDWDGDGLPDVDDVCPRELGRAESAGCPDIDSDGDQVVDRLDACPAEAEDRDGHQDGDGCVDGDDDADGVADADDRCPRQPETVNGFEDADGCPDEVPPAVKPFTGTISGIEFQLDSAEITPASFVTLDRAARVLADYPDLRVEIGGHTDATGTREHNLALSLTRAQAVKSYLAAKGVDPARLRAVGFGRDRPVAGNDTEPGRARNRRIEFRLLRSGE